MLCSHLFRRLVASLTVSCVAIVVTANKNSSKQAQITELCCSADFKRVDAVAAEIERVGFSVVRKAVAGEGNAGRADRNGQVKVNLLVTVVSIPFNSACGVLFNGV